MFQQLNYLKLLILVCPSNAGRSDKWTTVVSVLPPIGSDRPACRTQRNCMSRKLAMKFVATLATFDQYWKYLPPEHGKQ